MAPPTKSRIQLLASFCTRMQPARTRR
ncbi:unnamed protein product [Linum tenue]|uniref:Uncharacterized protein n=1 Tax=Linum tenue TaxID=586396 RepID=A0AAV0R629_9ROSI|nr:unnamed protein product [Linum tenue]